MALALVSSFAPEFRQDRDEKGPAPIIDARNVAVTFTVEHGMVEAVKDVSFQLYRGETIAIVGESGSGKSVTARTVMGLLSKRAVVSPQSSVDYDGKNVLKFSESARRRLRGDRISMIFQEPMSSLNPIYTIGTQIIEAIRAHRKVSRRDAAKRALELLQHVQIPDPEARLKQYPHQLSGGQRQRVMIAMAIANRPDILIADEPTTALDVTVQAQILELMRRLQREIGMGILFITHNLGLVAEIADRVEVMYGGRVVERADVDTLFAAPRHPYTRGLLGSLPVIDHALRRQKGRQRLPAIPGSVVDPRRPPAGCAFAPRCALALDACHAAVPAMEIIGRQRGSRCIRWREL